MANVVWTSAAERDLEGIFLYVGRDQQSPKAAAKMLHAIVAKCEMYSREPRLGAERPELGEDLRAFRIHRYVVIYRSSHDGIEVLRVIHGARDVSRVFQKGRS